MKVFHKKIKVRLLFLIVQVIVLVIMLTSLILFQDKLMLEDTMKGLQFGMLTGVLIVLIFMIISYCRVLLNDDYLQKLFVKENDERANYIEMKTGKLTIKILIILAAIGLFVASFINEMVTYTIYVVLLVIILTTFISKLYYNQKI